MRNIRRIAIVIIALIGMSACNEDKWLKEELVSSYVPSNSYSNTTQFRQALNYLYDDVRRLHWQLDDDNESLHFGDMAYGGTDYPNQKFNNWKTYFTALSNTSGFWNKAYNVIGNANVVLSRLTTATGIAEADKNTIKGEALFFRAFEYNFLANLYGRVPIILDELSSPKRDFVQAATRNEVYDQARIDLEAAIAILQDIDKVKDGQISKQAAQHLLTEVYISLGRYTDAINSSTAVISYPKMALMTTRFGTKKSDANGNPYWDLFQANNQNRTSGNTESLWVLQFEYTNTGSSYGLIHPRQGFPFYLSATVAPATGTAFVNAFTDITAEKGGRGIGVIHPTYYFLNKIWGADFNADYRNSSKMILRDCKIDNPKAKGFGQWLIKDGWIRQADTLRNFYPFILKFAIGTPPDDNFIKNADGSIKTTALGEKVTAYAFGGIPSNASLKDEYMFRLGGTYLLRAEAYIKANKPDLAAADINALRTRANASTVKVSDVNLDLLMDEQMKELYFEDFRVVTLMRMGKMVERTRKYNPQGYNVADNQNLFPIPFNEIDRNIFSKIEQNPGY